mmetsp:Transcript_32766/g.102872  ORF Transcript_32766/g.102872 Transcript_32766/m.102872 type:complete len:297 (-) Transcript_32766:129-1019(-)
MLSVHDARRAARAGEVAALERPALWRRAARRAVRLRPGRYGERLRAAREGACPPSVAKQIEKDLHRTFGSVHVRGVRVPQAEALSSLRNVLLAYASHNPRVGYCQSMNFVAAVLLLVVDEETAFACLATVVERVLQGHFADDMAMSLVDGSVLRGLLSAKDPQLMRHLEEMQVAPSLVTAQWLLTCFVASAMPLSALLRVWDCLFLEGDAALPFLLRLCAALFLSRRDELLAAHDPGEVYLLLMQSGASVGSAVPLLAAAYALPWDAPLLPHALAQLRTSHARCTRPASPPPRGGG